MSILLFSLFAFHSIDCVHCVLFLQVQRTDYREGQYIIRRSTVHISNYLVPGTRIEQDIHNIVYRTCPSSLHYYCPTTTALVVGVYSRLPLKTFRM